MVDISFCGSFGFGEEEKFCFNDEVVIKNYWKLR